MDVESLSCDEPDHGLLQTWGCNTEFGYNLSCCVMIQEIYSADDASITQASLFLRRRRSRDEKVGKYLRDGLLGYGDDKVRVNSVWEEGVYLVKFVSSELCTDKGICKSRTSRSPRSA